MYVHWCSNQSIVFIYVTVCIYQFFYVNKMKLKKYKNKILVTLDILDTCSSCLILAVAIGCIELLWNKGPCYICMRAPKKCIKNNLSTTNLTWITRCLTMHTKRMDLCALGGGGGGWRPGRPAHDRCTIYVFTLHTIWIFGNAIGNARIENVHTCMQFLLGTHTSFRIYSILDTCISYRMLFATMRY